MRILMGFLGIFVGQPFVELAHWCTKKNRMWPFHASMASLCIGYIMVVIALWLYS